MTEILRKVSDNPNNMSLNWRTKFYVREYGPGQCIFETLLTSKQCMWSLCDIYSYFFFFLKMGFFLTYYILIMISHLTARISSSTFPLHSGPFPFCLSLETKQASMG